MAIASHARMDSTSTILPQRFQRVMPLCCVSVTSMRQVRQLGLLTQPQNFAVSTIDKRWRSLVNRLHVPQGWPSPFIQLIPDNSCIRQGERSCTFRM